MLAELHLSPWAIEHKEAFVAQVIGFLLLAALLWWKAAPAARTLLGDRSARIEETQNQVARALSEVQTLYDDYANRLRGIEEEARQRIDAAVREAETVRNEIIADALESAALLRRRSEEEIARERTRQRIMLRRQIVQISLDAAEQSVISHSDDRVQRALIQGFIKNVSGNGHGATATLVAPAKQPAVAVPEIKAPQTAPVVEAVSEPVASVAEIPAAPTLEPDPTTPKTGDA